MRSNVSAGGKVRKADTDEVVPWIAEIIRLNLVMEGMFLVGLDIVGDKLMEVNIFCPGGPYSAQQLEAVHSMETVIVSLERMVP